MFQFNPEIFVTLQGIIFFEVLLINLKYNLHALEFDLTQIFESQFCNTAIQILQQYTATGAPIEAP